MTTKSKELEPNKHVKVEQLVLPENTWVVVTKQLPNGHTEVRLTKQPSNKK